MRWLVVSMLFILYVVNYADKSVLGLAAESIIKDLHLNFEQFGVVGSSLYWSFGIGSILISSLTFLFGTKKLITFIAFGWTISLVSVYFVNSLTGLIVIRVALGFFEGGTLALCLAHIAKWFVDGTRGTANAILLSGAVFGAYLTAPVLVQLIQGFGWRNTFAILGAVSLVWLIIFLFFKEQPKETIDKGSSSIDSKPNMSFKEILKIILSPYFISLLLSFFTAIWVLTWVSVWGPTYLTKIVGLSPNGMSLVFAGIGISASIISIILGKVTDRLFKKTRSHFNSYIRVVVIAMVCGAIALCISTVVTSPVLAILLLIIALSMNNSIAPITSSVVSSMVPINYVGSLLGVKTALASTAGIIAPIITGILVSNAGKDVRAGFHYGVLVAALLYFLSAIFLILSSRREKQTIEKSEISLIISEEATRN